MAGVADGHSAVRTFMKHNDCVLPVSKWVVRYSHVRKWHLYMVDQSGRQECQSENYKLFSVLVFLSNYLCVLNVNLSVWCHFHNTLSLDMGRAIFKFNSKEPRTFYAWRTLMHLVSTW
jgi:hypothetical protein